MAFEGTPDQFPEAARSRDQLLARARELAWYHTLRLDPAFTTSGIFALDEFVPFYLLPPSLEGLDCLEVAAGNGYWSFEMERRAARSVTATDIGNYFDTDFSILHGQPPLCAAPSPDGAYGEPYRVAATLLGSRVTYRICSVYDLAPERIGTYDLVFCGSMLMHLFGPLLALHRIASICRNTFLVTTQVDLTLEDEPAAVFKGHEIPYVHFIPSPACLVRMVTACGYEKVLRGPTFFLRFRDRQSNPGELPHTTLVGLKDAKHPAFGFAPPRLLTEDERLASIEIVSAPVSVTPHEVFDVLVRVVNESSVTWRGDEPGLELRLDYDAQIGTARHAWTPVTSEMPFLDILPAGVSTLAKLRVRAPDRVGTMRLRPFVNQAGRRFTGRGAICEVRVSGAAAGPLKRATIIASRNDVRWLRPAWNAVRGLPGSNALRTAAKKILGIHD